MSVQLDMGSRTFTAEVIRSRGVAAVVNGIAALLDGTRTRFQVSSADPTPIEVLHGFVASPLAYHRATRTVRTEANREVTIPREKRIRNRVHFLYDVLIFARRQYVLVAVPFHGIAEDFFVRVDEALAGTRNLYETLNITQMVIELDQRRSSTAAAERPDIAVTKCQLAYSDAESRSTNLQQARLAGTDLRRSKIYRDLTEPIRSQQSQGLTVTPVLLGFALLENGVRRSSAVTDRHGNFKLWIGATPDRVARTLDLLESVAELSGVRGSTSNLPILQSRTIRDEDAG